MALDVRLIGPFASAFARLIALLAFVALCAFLLAKLSPIDPVDAYLGPAIGRVGEAQRAAIAAAWGLDRPWPTQFLLWLGNLLSGDAGYSLSYNAPVAEVIAARAGPSLALAGTSWLLSSLVGFMLGILASVYEDTALDRIVRGWSFVLASTPTFWLAILMLTVFSVGLGWAPLCCAGPIGVRPQDVSLAQALAHLALPLLTLTLFGVAQIALHTRAKAIVIMRSDHVRFAFAQGAGRLDIAIRHVARNAALPGIALMLASIGELFGGAMLAEQVFAYPGLGRAAVDAGLQGDVPLLLAITLLTAFVVGLGGMAARLVAKTVDPRLRNADLAVAP